MAKVSFSREGYIACVTLCTPWSAVRKLDAAYFLVPVNATEKLLSSGWWWLGYVTSLVPCSVRLRDLGGTQGVESPTPELSSEETCAKSIPLSKRAVFCVVVTRVFSSSLATFSIHTNKIRCTQLLPSFMLNCKNRAIFRGWQFSWWPWLGNYGAIPRLKRWSSKYRDIRNEGKRHDADKITSIQDTTPEIG